MSQLRRRREILKLSVLALGALPVGCYRAGVDPQPLSEDDSQRFFPQSVASGDPRPDSIVLWTRVEDAAHADKDVDLELTLALDEDLTQLVDLGPDATSLTALAAADHCLQVRIGELTPDTVYYYRFAYRSFDGVAQTRVGRTRTAPAEDSTRNVKLAVMCCQDYGGKYFHVARHIASQDVDFVLHLGDYIYETVGDTSFQDATAARQVVFSAPKEALKLQRGDTTALAAQSLSNYRDLYKQYRTDPDLQALHERHPMIVIWDDHEFSDDSHGDVATYFDGRQDETEPARRAAADQAWWEYMPVDYQVEPAASFNAAQDFPDNFVVYRSFVFGQNLELVVTDLRRFRPDHLVPEDAAPGAIYLNADDVQQYLDPVPDDLVPYVDIETQGDGAYLAALQGGADQLGMDPASFKGSFSAVWINDALEKLGSSTLKPIDLEDPKLPRGYAYHSLLKTDQYSKLGSRYLVAVGPFEALAKKRWEESKGESERLMGDTQRKWFLDTISKSSRAFKLWASEVVLQSRHIDLSQSLAAPEALRRLISISAEDWDGFPNERRALLSALGAAGNVLVLSGDVHCFFAGAPFVEGDDTSRVVELTTGSVTSTGWLESIQGGISNGGPVDPGVQSLLQVVPSLLADTTLRPNPHLAFQDLASHGYSIVEVGPERIDMTTYFISAKAVATPPKSLGKKLDELFSTTAFRVERDQPALQQEISGTYLTWDPSEMMFT